MEITACPVCGSTNIGIGTLGDGIISGLSSWKEVCRNCGYQGSSLLFESEEEYQKFLTALKKHKMKTSATGEERPSEKDTDEFTTEDTEIAAALEDTGRPPQPPAKRSYLFEFILAVILSILFFSILIGGSLFGINTVFSNTDVATLVLYLLGSFIGVLIFFFLLIVFVETLYRSLPFRRTPSK
jgi:transcription elongation factor Elf1